MTILEMLTEAGFDWDTGKIILQESEGYAPGWARQILSTKLTKDFSEAILHEEFDDGYGSPQCPRFVAKDNRKIYFPTQYDGSTSIDSVFINITEYLDIINPTPYPGG